MGPLRLAARPMLSAIFVSGGVAQLTDPESHAPVAKDVTDTVQDAVGDTAPAVAEADTTQLVQLNGIAQVVGGLLLAAGKMPRLAALLLAGSLVPTTLAAHRFWEEDDPEAKQEQQVHFFKNISLLGGLLIATMDREGKPSLAWRGGHAVDHAKIAADHAAEVTRLKGELAKEKAKRATTTATAGTAAAGAVVAEKAKRKGAVAAEKAKRTKDVATERAKRATAVDAGDHLRTRAELTKKRLTPDITDAKSLVDAVRSDD